jgi:hypothetical protein
MVAPACRNLTAIIPVAGPSTDREHNGREWYYTICLIQRD